MYLCYIVLKKDGSSERRCVSFPEQKDEDKNLAYCNAYLAEINRTSKVQVVDSRLSSKPIGKVESNLWEEYHCC
jgi:hypothetical protein